MPNALGNFLAPSRAEIDQEKYGNALLRNQVNRLPQANRMQDLDLQAAEQDIGIRKQAASQQQRQSAAGIAANMALAVAQSQDPVNDAQRLFGNPQFQSAVTFLGLQAPQYDPQKDTPESLRAGAATFARALGAQPPTQLETFERDGALLQRDPSTGALRQVMSREPAPSQSEPVVSVVDPQTGQPMYVPRSQAAGRQPYQKPTAALSSRDASTARNKLTQINLARQQLGLVQQKFDALKGSMSAGPMGQGRVPSPSGQAFDTAVNSMRDIISGITRVPGVGAMSDFETRLNQSKMPDRTLYEGNTQQQIDSLRSMLDSLEQGYGGLLQDSGAPQGNEAVPQGVDPEDWKYMTPQERALWQ